MLSLPEEYRPAPRTNKGLVFGSIAAAAQATGWDAAREEFRMKGGDVVVAIVSTGIGSDAQMQRYKAVKESDSPFDGSDEHGLGTFLAAIIAGQQPNQGLTPSVRCCSLKIVDGEARWSIERLARALEHLAQISNEERPIKVVLLAVSDGAHFQSFIDAEVRYGVVTRRVEKAVANLRNQGIVVVAPSGDRQLQHDEAGIAFPAIVPGVLACPAVAALPEERTLNIDDRKVTWSLSEGQLIPTSQRPHDPAKLRETIAAPGCVELSEGLSVPQARLRGGSMQAAAIVAAAIALQQQFHLDQTDGFASADRINRWLLEGARLASGRPDDIEGPAGTILAALSGSYPQLDLFQTLTRMRAVLLPTGMSEQTPDTGPRTLEERRFGNLSEIAEGIGLTEAISRLATENDPQPRLLGQGTCVAILATGIVKDHPDFADRVVATVDFVGPGANDSTGYGTFLAGVIGARSGTERGNQGIAPSTKFAVVKVLDENGASDFESHVHGLRWVAENRERYGISVVLLAAGTGHYHSWEEARAAQASFDVIRNLVRALRSNGVMVLAPAGNLTGDEAEESRRVMAYPAIIPEVFAVAAMEFDADSSDAADAPTSPNTSSQETARAAFQIPARLASYSCRLPELTDIVAPGGPLISSSLDFSRGSALRGTSVSAAVTAGAALLVQGYYLSGHKGLPPADYVERCLQEGAWYVEDSEAEFPRLNVLGALQWCYRESIQRQSQQ